jgi:hypothetical protein
MIDLKEQKQAFPKPEMQTSRPQRTAAYVHPGMAFEDSANLGRGIFFGLIAAIGGASLWAVVTAVTNYQIGWMAIGVGFVTGWAVRMGGKGTSQRFGIAGAVLALFGCLLGNLMTECYFASEHFDTSFFNVFFSLNGEIIGTIFTETFQPIHLLFYGLAVYAGYRYSRNIEEKKSA